MLLARPGRRAWSRPPAAGQAGNHRAGSRPPVAGRQIASPTGNRSGRLSQAAGPAFPQHARPTPPRVIGRIPGPRLRTATSTHLPRVLSSVRSGYSRSPARPRLCRLCAPRTVCLVGPGRTDPGERLDSRGTVPGARDGPRRARPTTTRGGPHDPGLARHATNAPGRPPTGHTVLPVHFLQDRRCPPCTVIVCVHVLQDAPLRHVTGSDGYGVSARDCPGRMRSAGQCPAPATARLQRMRSSGTCLAPARAWPARRPASTPLGGGPWTVTDGGGQRPFQVTDAAADSVAGEEGFEPSVS